MAASSSIDMQEVTRLTRAGRLSEAMALLQGRALSGDPPAAKPHAAHGPRGPALEMEPPSMPGGAWTAPGFAALERLAKMEATPARFPAGLGSRPPVAIPNGARFEERIFANEAGQRSYKVYAPSAYRGQALPVIVMLHGCTQSADDFAAGTRMNALAEEEGFLVVYPEQSRSANAQKCWNWFNGSDQRRDGGEASLIAGMTRAVIGEFGADPTRVYAAGLSAGGAAACILAAAYPDLFAAIGVHSGLACGAAEDMPSAFKAMKGGGKVRARYTPNPVPTIVFHGDADGTVSPVNGDQIIAQAAGSGLSAAKVSTGKSAGGMAYTRTVRTDDSGRAVLEHWVLHGGGHAWSGGSPDGSFTDPRGPDASREMARFFKAHKMSTGHAG